MVRYLYAESYNLALDRSTLCAAASQHNRVRVFTPQRGCPKDTNGFHAHFFTTLTHSSREHDVR
jgi:hypothetical protein